MRFRSLVAALTALAVMTPTARPAEKIALNVLYAGNPESARTKDFSAFLEKQFAKVTAVNLANLREADTKDHDVVIIDWTSIYSRDKSGKIDNAAGQMSMPPALHLSADYARPTVLIGAAGGQVAGTRGLKINWL